MDKILIISVVTIYVFYGLIKYYYKRTKIVEIKSET